MAKTSIEMCIHCDDSPAGAEGTIWCQQCLEWYREEYARYGSHVVDGKERQMPEVKR